MDRQTILRVGFLVVLVLISGVSIIKDFPAKVFNPYMDPQLYRFEVHGPRYASCYLNNFYIDIDVDKNVTIISFRIGCDGEIPAKTINIEVPPSLILTEYSWITEDGYSLKAPNNFNLRRGGGIESNIYYFNNFSTKIDGEASFAFSGDITPNGRFLVNTIDFKMFIVTEKK